MNRLKKIWSLTAICGMMIGIFPMSIFAETIETASVVINQATITDIEDQEITENNRLKEKDPVKVKLNWSLDKETLIEENTMMSIALPANLNYPAQSGELGEMGSYQVSNQQLIFTFNKNYQEMTDGRAPDFASAKFYEGVVEFTAETTAEGVETENVDFGNKLVSTLYYDKKVDPAADPVIAQENKTEKFAIQPHSNNLNDRDIELFDNIDITDLNGKPFTTENPAVKDANIKIHFDWSLEDDEVVLDKDYYTYQLPEYFSVHNIVDGDLYDKTNDVVMGTFHLDIDGKLTITFNDKVEKLSDREGTIDLRTELKVENDVDQIEITTGIEDEDSQEITIVIPIAKADIQKTGVLKADNSVVWTIIANQKRLNLKNAKIIERIPEGLSNWYHVNYVQGEDGNWNRDNKGFFKVKLLGTGKYEFSFNGDLNVPVKIEFYMRITDKSKSKYLNQVSIEGDNFQTNQAEASVAFSDNANYKKLTSHNVNTGIFNWEAKATFKGNGGTFKDWTYNKVDLETALHFLKEGTLKVYGADGQEVTTGWNLTQDKFKKDGNGMDQCVSFTLTFDDPGVYTIKYDTEAFEKPVRHGTIITNNAEVKDEDGSTNTLTGGETVKVSGKLGVKKTHSRNNTDSTVSYKVEINTKKTLMKNAEIVDRFESLSGKYQSAMQLDKTTLVIKNEAGESLKVGTDYDLEPLENDTEYKKGFKVKLKGDYAETKETLTMTYKARYFVDEQKKNEYEKPDLRFDNSVMVYYLGENNEQLSDGDEETFWLDPGKFAVNGFKNGVFVSEGKKVIDRLEIYKENNQRWNPFDEEEAPEDSVYWSAVFNTWNTTIPKDTEIKEALGEGQDLRNIKIYDVGLNSPLKVIQVGDTPWEIGEDYVITNDSNGVPTIKLLKDKNRMFAIFVAARASEKVYKYKNVATMTVPNEKALVVEGMAEKSDKKSWIDKDGKQGTGDDYRLINWSVVLNKDGHKVVDPSIKDTVNIADQTFVCADDKNVG